MLPMQSTGSPRRTRPAKGGKEDDMTRTAHRSRVRWALVLLAATTTLGCFTNHAAPRGAPAKYLFIWAGPHGADSAPGGMGVLDSLDPSKRHQRFFYNVGFAEPGPSNSRTKSTASQFLQLEYAVEWRIDRSL